MQKISQIINTFNKRWDIANIIKLYGNCQNQYIFSPRMNFMCNEPDGDNHKKYLCKYCGSLMCYLCIAEHHKKCVNCAKKTPDNTKCLSCGNDILGTACNKCGNFIKFCSYICEDFLQNYDISNHKICCGECEKN